MKKFMACLSILFLAVAFVMGQGMPIPPPPPGNFQEKTNIRDVGYVFVCDDVSNPYVSVMLVNPTELKLGETTPVTVGIKRGGEVVFYWKGEMGLTMRLYLPISPKPEEVYVSFPNTKIRAVII